MTRKNYFFIKAALKMKRNTNQQREKKQQSFRRIENYMRWNHENVEKNERNPIIKM